ncbi:hypothetical protein MG293_008026, partial [Ovis ammon polii]
MTWLSVILISGGMRKGKECIERYQVKSAKHRYFFISDAAVVDVCIFSLRLSVHILLLLCLAETLEVIRFMEPLRFYSIVNNPKPASYVLVICGEKLVVLHKEANYNQKGPDSGDRQTELDCQLAALFVPFTLV